MSHTKQIRPGLAMATIMLKSTIAGIIVGTICAFTLTVFVILLTMVA